MEKVTRRSWLNWFSAIPATLLSVFLLRKDKLIAEPLTLTPIEEAMAMRKQMEDNFPFEKIIVRGDLAFSEWQRLKNQGTHWPVVIGTREDFDRILENSDNSFLGALPKDILAYRQRTVEQILEDAEKLNFPTDLKNWSGSYQKEDLTAPLGQWPQLGRLVSDGLSVATNILTNQFHESVIIVLVPTLNSWEVPAYLRWGDWNACPPPEYHVAALKKWHAEYGAELIGISGDVLDIRVKKRPETKGEAIRLARDQYYYCPDIIDQGAETISNLAAALKISDWWSFWWD